MYKGAALQIAHAGSDLSGHVHEDHSVYVLAVSSSQVVQQVAAAHELCDDVKWWFPGADTEELHEIWVSHLFHYGSFL